LSADDRQNITILRQFCLRSPTGAECAADHGLARLQSPAVKSRPLYEALARVRKWALPGEP